MSLAARALWIPRPHAERADGKRRSFATFVRAPLVASGFFALCSSKTVRGAIAAMPQTARMPGDELLQYADVVWWWTYGGGMAIAFAGIYAAAAVNKAFTELLWRLFALVSPAGVVPTWPWFVKRASAICVWVGVAAIAAGLFLPGEHSNDASRAIDTLVRDHATWLLLVTLALVFLQHLRLERAAIVSRDIWGTRTRALLAAFMRMVLLLSLPLLFALMNQLWTD